MMEKVDLKSGHVIAQDAAFHSKTEVNLESTDCHEQFSKMKETELEFLAAKKAIINLKNEDDECFKWAITRALNPVEKTLNVLIKNFEKHQRISIGRD